MGHDVSNLAEEEGVQLDAAFTNKAVAFCTKSVAELDQFEAFFG